MSWERSVTYVSGRAEKLFVDAHRGKIMEKLNLHSTSELVRFAVRQGLID
jgi:FixJ family two-component response regulator